MMFWLGDNLYLQQPDLFDPASMASRYRRQRAFPPLQSLLTATPHIAIWDDHDYGPNDSDASYVLESYDTDGMLLWRHAIAARELRFERGR